MDKRPTPRSIEEAASPAGTPIRTLIVEDDAGTRSALKRLLNSGVFLPVPVASAEAARGALAAERFDVAVIDLHLGDESGCDLIEWIRERDQNVGIVIATGYPEALSPHEFADLDVDDVVSKPYSAADLQARVFHAAARRRQEADRCNKLCKILDSVDRLNAALDDAAADAGR